MAVLSPALDPAQPTGLLAAVLVLAASPDARTAVADALGHLPPPPAAERAQVLERAARLVDQCLPPRSSRAAPATIGLGARRRVRAD